jgi:hypothetical protein
MPILKKDYTMAKIKENDTATIYLKSGQKLNIYPVDAEGFQAIKAKQARSMLSGSYELGDNIWVDRKQVEVITWQNGEVF